MGLREGYSCVHSLRRQLRASVTLEPVWITDDLLADTFRRFAHNSKRHGSHVPGPLEARKRARKRLNSHTSFNGGAPPPLDPSLLFPASAKLREPMVETSSSLPRSFLPLWLFPAQHATTKNESTRPAEPITHTQKPHDEEELEEIIAALRSASSVQEVQNVTASIPDRFLDGVHKSITSSMFSAWVGRESKWTVDGMAKLLTEPHLRLLPGQAASQSVRAIESLPPKKPSIFLRPDNWLKIFSAICQAVELGLVDADAWSSVFKLLPDVLHRIRNDNDGEPTDIPGSRWHSLQMLASLRKCPVLSITDLDDLIRFEVWLKVRHFGPLPAVLELLETLVLKPHAQNAEMKPLATCMASWLSSPKLHPVVVSHKNEIACFLLGLPKDDLLSILTKVTENLLVDSKIRRRNIDDNRLQREMLIYLTTDVLMGEHKRQFLTPQDILKIHESFGTRSTRVEKLTMTFWLLRATCYGWDRVTHHGQTDLDHRWVIEVTYWRHAPDPSRILQWLAMAVKASSYLPLTNRGRRAFLLELARIISRPMSYPSEAPCVQREPFTPSPGFSSIVQIQMLSNEFFWTVAKKRFKPELKLFCDNASSNLPLLLKILIEADGKDYDGFIVVSRVFYWSRTMKLALQQTRLHRAEWRSVTAWEHAFIVRSKPFPGLDIKERSCSEDGKPLPSPEVCTDVISRMVLHIATNEKLANTLAYNRVRWFWRFLRHHRVEMSPIITRCLWHAGVTRFAADGERYSPVRLRWILTQVVMWEGAEVARLLAEDGTFRKHRGDVLLLLKEIIETQNALEGKQLDEDGEMAPAIRGELQSEDGDGVGLFDDPNSEIDDTEDQ
jgi:hypothetical protein